MEKTIEIPEGYEARIEGNKVILEQKENEDEKTRQELLSFIRAEKKYTPETVPGEHWDRWIAYLERQKMQNPAEWSEEDKNALEYLHELIGFGYTEKFMDAQTAADMREWVNKSLRPQPHWKPSEEQLSALKEQTSWLSKDNLLHSLYYQLCEL